MATTEEWIEWSREFASPYWHTNHQLFIEMAMACCRWYRDEGGLSTVPELANAEHYWFARWWTFATGGASGDIVATPFEVLSPSVGTVAGQVGAYSGMVVGGALISAMAVAWDGLKRAVAARGHGARVPGGAAPPSPPSLEQIGWAARGYADALVLDAPYMSEMSWGFVMRELPGTTRLPDPLH